MKNFLVIFNGQANCGKDTLENFMADQFWSQRIENKESLYELGAKVYNIPYSAYRELCVKRELKDTISPLLKGLTPRQSIIHVSNVVKSQINRSAFSIDIAKRVESYFDGNNESCIVTTNIGYQDEYDDIVQYLTGKNIDIILINLTKDSENDDIKLDARETIINKHDNVKTFEIVIKKDNAVSVAENELSDIISSCITS